MKAAPQDEGDSQRTPTVLPIVGHRGPTLLPNILVTGKLTQLSYESPDGRSLLEVFTNYKEGLEKAGFEILFNCAETQCGPLRQVIGRLHGTSYTAPSMRFISAKRKQGDKETYVQINMIEPRHEIYVLERTEMERGLVVVTPEAIKQGLLAEGRVVLDGILFDHGPGQCPALAPSLQCRLAELSRH